MCILWIVCLVLGTLRTFQYTTHTTISNWNLMADFVGSFPESDSREFRSWKELALQLVPQFLQTFFFSSWRASNVFHIKEDKSQGTWILLDIKFKRWAAQYWGNILPAPSSVCFWRKLFFNNFTVEPLFEALSNVTEINFSQSSRSISPEWTWGPCWTLLIPCAEFPSLKTSQFSFTTSNPYR